MRIGLIYSLYRSCLLFVQDVNAKMILRRKENRRRSRYDCTNGRMNKWKDEQWMNIQMIVWKTEWTRDSMSEWAEEWTAEVLETTYEQLIWCRGLNERRREWNTYIYYLKFWISELTLEAGKLYRTICFLQNTHQVSLWSVPQIHQWKSQSFVRYYYS